MKKGFTLVELMVVITITGILAAVAIPKIFGMVCKSDLHSCKVDTPQLYKDVCLRSPKFCPISDVDSICWSAPNECMNESTNHGTWYLVQSYRQEKRAAEKAKKEAEAQVQPVPQPVVQPIREVVHDTVYVLVNNAVVHVTDEPAPANAINVTTDKNACIEYCKKNNVSESLVQFCIKDKCK